MYCHRARTRHCSDHELLTIRMRKPSKVLDSDWDMRKLLLIAAAATSLTACTYYRPSLEDRIQIVDSPADIRACRRLGEVSGGVLPSSPGFVHHIDAMLTATVALGGTDLFLQRVASDWSY